MTPEERREIYPKFIVRSIEKEEPTGTPRTKITDFLHLLRTTWVISNKEYQERFWVRQELPMRGDNYMETMETFLGDGRAVLDTSDYAVEMTLKQREMLQKLYTMLDDFDGDGDSADDPGYGINDAAIIEDPKFAKCREYAKLVYEELSGDDLDAWEQQRK